MHVRLVAVALLLTLTALAGCASKAPESPGPAAAAGAVSNLGGAVDQAIQVTSVVPGKYNFTGPYSRVLVPGPLALKDPELVQVPSPLGSGDIEIGLHLPDTTEKVPVLVFASPYFFATDSQTEVPGAGSVGGGARTVLDRTPGSSFFSLVENLVPHGYAVAAVAVRGTAGSDGCNDLMGPDEIDDLDAAVTWLGEQPWSTGAIAMTGVSYDGSTPWSVASRGNPYLKTIIPISGVPDIYGLMYRNGSSEQRGPFLLNALYIEGSYASGNPSVIPERICPEAYQGLALSGVAGAAGTDPTGYWAERNRKPGVEANYKGSVFSIQGLQDWNVDPSQVVPWVDHLQVDQGLRTKQWLGQWEHSWPDSIGEDGEGMDCPNGNAGVPICNRADWKEVLLRWLDKELKGLDVDTGAPVQVTDDLGRWRNEADYPPHDTTWTTYHLNHGVLTAEPGSRQSAILYPRASDDNSFPPDPPAVTETSVQKAADFALPPAQTDLLVVGLPKVHITLTPQGPGGYLGATLIDRDADGNERQVGWTTMNLGYADGSTEFTPVVPQQALEAKMEIQPMDSVILAGHQLVLRLWVLTDRDRLPTIPPSPIALETGGDIHSVLELPTVVRDPAVYFTPPSPPLESGMTSATATSTGAR